jgi:exopolysaccharide production protein ExoQ
VPSSVATLFFLISILGLFWLDHDPAVHASKALWIPTVWLLINCSRPVSMWLGVTYAGGVNVYLEGSPIDRAVYMILEAAGFAVIFARRKQIGPILRRNWSILLFFAYAAFSILWSDFPLVTFKHWIKGIGDVTMVLIVLTEPIPLDAIKRLITRVSFVLLPLSVLFIKYYPALGRLLTNSWTMEWTGVTTQKNTLGGICLVFGLGVMWCFRSVYKDSKDPHRIRRLVALGAVLGIAIWLLRTCDSVTSFATLGVAGVVMMLSERPAISRKPVVVHVLVGALIAISIYALFFQSSGTLVADLGRNRTLTGRTEIWSQVLNVPVNRMVGAGYESFWLGDRLLQVWKVARVNEAHDGYLEMVVNLGWVGLSLLGFIIVTGYGKAIAALRINSEIGSLSLAWLLAAALRGLTEAAFRMLSSSWMFLLLAVFAASQVASGRAPSPIESDHNDGTPEFDPTIDSVMTSGRF